MIMLLGNHEQMCLNTLGPHNEFGARDLWRKNGGGTTYRELLYHCTPQKRNRILRFLSGLPDYLELTAGHQAIHRRLACLRLDDRAEFYVGGTGTKNET